MSSGNTQESGGMATNSLTLMEEAVAAESAPKTVNNPMVSWFLNYRGTLIGILVVLSYLLGGAVVFYVLRKDGIGNFGDAYYLAVVTFLTIGYGDLAPKSEGSKIFCIFYIFGALVVQATVGGYVLANLVSVDEEEKFKREAKGSTDSYLRLRPQFISLAKACLVLVALVFLGTLLLAVTEDESFLDSLYWAVVTLTTVGYGDITPSSNKAYFATYFLFGVLSFGFLVGQCIGIVMEVYKLDKLRKFFREGLTVSMLERMDIHKDGQINRDEFIIFMLRAMDLANTEQISRILGIFDTLDAQGDGILDVQDVKRKIQSGSVPFKKEGANNTIHRDEFLVFMLKAMDIATSEQIQRILGVFQTLDFNGDEMLDLCDIRRKRSHASSTAITPEQLDHIRTAFPATSTAPASHPSPVLSAGGENHIG